MVLPDSGHLNVERFIRIFKCLFPRCKIFISLRCWVYSCKFHMVLHMSFNSPVTLMYFLLLIPPKSCKIFYISRYFVYTFPSFSISQTIPFLVGDSSLIMWLSLQHCTDLLTFCLPFLLLISSIPYKILYGYTSYYFYNFATHLYL